MAVVEGHRIGGTRHAGYIAEGPTNCASCEYFVWPHLCKQPLVILDAKSALGGLRLHQGGKAIVKPNGCCIFWERG